MRRLLAAAAAALACGVGGFSAAQAGVLSGELPLDVHVKDAAGNDTVQARTYLVYTPTTPDPAKGLIVYLHGGGSSGAQAARSGTDGLWQALADKYGVYVAFPDGINGGWNSCASTEFDNPANGRPGRATDDVAFVRQLIAQEVADHHIDARRVYAVGHSEGSKMAERLALEANDAVAAVGVIAGNLPYANDFPVPAFAANGGYKCKGYTAPWSGAPGDRAVGVFLFKGDLDPRIPFGNTAEGGLGHRDVAVDHKPYCQIKEAPGAVAPDCPVGGAQHSFYETLAFWQWKQRISPFKWDTAPANLFPTVYADTVARCPDPRTEDARSMPSEPGCGFIVDATQPGLEPTQADFHDPTGAFPDHDGSQVTRYTYGLGIPRLIFDRARGGGHCFPGPSPGALTIRDALATGGCDYEASGWKNRDMLTSAADPYPYVAEKMWRFFQSFQLPASTW